MANRWGNSGNSVRLYFFLAPKSLQMVIAAMKLKDPYSLKESYDQLRQHIKKQRHHFVKKGPSSQGSGFSCDHVWIWELDYKESWAPKNWYFWTVVLKKTLESPLDCKESHPTQSILKEISPGCSLEGLMLKLKLQYFGHLMQRADWFEKTLKLGKIESRRRRKMRWLDGITDLMDMCFGGLRELVKTGRPGVLWFMGPKRLDTTERLDWTDTADIQLRLYFFQKDFLTHKFSCFSHMLPHIFSLF